MKDEMNSSMIYLIYCKNICKCHNVPPPSTTIKKEKKFFKKTLSSGDSKMAARGRKQKVNLL
jgi:hypothetical protein